MTKETLPNWIDKGEKYALIGLEVKTEGAFPLGKITKHLSVLSGTGFDIPDNWREWLGSIRTEEISRCNLLLFTKMASTKTGILDEENIILKQCVWEFYAGLLLSSPFSPSHDPALITGARQHGEISIRQHQNLNQPIPILCLSNPPLLPDEIVRAGRLAENFETIRTKGLAGGQWRINRIITVYREARETLDILDRIHQFIRCIEGLILPDPGRTKQQFKSRTELFIGTTHHDLMGELYDVRSAVEHLHENHYLENFDRKVRLELARKEAIAEFIARTSIARIVENANLWTYFGNTSALKEFWKLSPDERRRIWGEPLHPMTAVKDFDPRYVNNSQLGVRDD